MKILLKNMQCFMIAFLYSLFVHGSEGITTHSVTECSDRVILNCSNIEMIHVERITYYNITDCNQAITDLHVCGQPLTGSDTGLVPYCNGKTTCNENLNYNTCPGSKAAKVNYRCIPRSNVKDMCGSFMIKHIGRIFLSTPNFTFYPTFTDIISSCICFIRGSSITSIQILELALQTSNDGTKSSLEIKYGDVTYKTESFNDTSLTRRVYNKRLSTTSATAEIILNHNSINRQYLWIEVQGVAMYVACSVVTTSTLFTKSPPTTTTKKSPVTSTPSPKSPPRTTNKSPVTSPSSSSSSSPSSPTSLQSFTEPQSSTESAKSPTNKDTIIIILAVLFSLCPLIICIAAIIIVILIKKKLPSGERESNTYSGLDRTQRASGNDGSYQELNTRNSTVQYYNASQDTQHDYQYVS